MPRLKGVRQRGRSFFYRIRAGGEDRTISLGRDLDLAVKQVLEIRRRLKAGLPPTDERTGLNPEDLPFVHLEQRWLDDYRAQQRRSAPVVELRLRYLRQHFGKMLARDITFDRVNGYVADRLEAAKPATVRYERALLGRMLRLA